MRLRSSRSSSDSSRRSASSLFVDLGQGKRCLPDHPAPIAPGSLVRMGEVETRLAIGGERVAGAGAAIAVENPFTEETVATVSAPSDEQLDAAIAAAAEAQRGWERTPAVERGELLHEVATRLRARTDELAELMTLEGGKPLIENSDEIGWTAAAFDYYAEIGRDSAGRVIPLDRGEPARAGGQGPGRAGRLHRALELPAAAARLEARAGARRRQRHRLASPRS